MTVEQKREAARALKEKQLEAERSGRVESRLLDEALAHVERGLALLQPRLLLLVPVVAAQFLRGRILQAQRRHRAAMVAYLEALHTVGCALRSLMPLPLLRSFVRRPCCLVSVLRCRAGVSMSQRSLYATETVFFAVLCALAVVDAAQSHTTYGDVHTVTTFSHDRAEVGARIDAGHPVRVSVFDFAVRLLSVLP